jgi:beta-glucosidase
MRVRIIRTSGRVLLTTALLLCGCSATLHRDTFPYSGNYPEWDARFAVQNEQLKRRADFLFFGDSNVERWEEELWQHCFDDGAGINLGISGDRTEHLIWRMQHGQLDGPRPRLIIIHAGTNNLWTDEVDKIISDLRFMVSLVKQKHPGVRIVMFHLLPIWDEEYQEKARGVNAGMGTIGGVTVIPVHGDFAKDPGRLMPDRIHPSKEGYGILCSQLKPILRLVVGVRVAK